jgi:dTDP-4-dehydrorhamnose reductase
MTGRRVVILGAAGQLGRQLVRAFESAGDAVTGPAHGTFDLTDPAAPSQLLELGPEIVVNAAAWTDVDGCARDPERAMEINGAAPGRLAGAVAEIEAAFVQISTNEVFGGESADPYGEDAAPNPINPYGSSKLAGEREVAAANPNHLIVRTAWIFGPGGTNFPSKIVVAARKAHQRGASLRVVADEYGNPTWAPDLADRVEQAVTANLRGVLHLAGEPPATRYEWARVILADVLDVKLEAISRDDYERPAPVPARAILSTDRARDLGIGPMDWRPRTREYAADLVTMATTS